MKEENKGNLGINNRTEKSAILVTSLMYSVYQGHSDRSISDKTFNK